MEGLRRRQQSSFNFNSCSSNFDDLLEDDSDAVCITTRHNDHASSVLKSLNANKHVYVEKPLALNFDELSEIYKSFYSNKFSTLMVGFNRRFSPHLDLISKHFDKNLSSMVISIRVNAGRIDKNHWIQDPNEGGGRIIGEVCHFIDLASAISKSIPIKIYTTSITRADESALTNDNVSINLEFQSGAIANIIYTSEGLNLFQKNIFKYSLMGNLQLLMILKN